MSQDAMKVTEKGRLKPLKNMTVKIVERFFDRKAGRWKSTVSWNGCFNYTLHRDRLAKTLIGESGFVRRRGAC